MQSSNGDNSPTWMMKATCAGLAMVTFLVMEGQCQDEFLHCTNPGSELERINVTFRWIRQRGASCPLIRTVVACCLPTCAQGSSIAVTELVGNGIFWGLWVFPGVLCIWRGGERRRGGTSFAGLSPHVHTVWATQVCLSLDTPFGRRSVEALSSWSSGSSLVSAYMRLQK